MTTIGNFKRLRNELINDLNIEHYTCSGITRCSMHITTEEIIENDIKQNLADFEQWSKTAKRYDDFAIRDSLLYTYVPEYEIVIYKNDNKQTLKHPIRMTPELGHTLIKIKKDCAIFHIEDTGHIDIHDMETDTPVLRYEHGKWSKL